MNAAKLNRQRQLLVRTFSSMVIKQHTCLCCVCKSVKMLQPKIQKPPSAAVKIVG